MKTDLQLTRHKWRTKRQHAKRRDIDFNLTFDQYCELLEKAGITVDDIGQASHQYCLGRYNDEGDYSIDNCRFITSYENSQEAKLSRKLHELNPGGGSYDEVKGNTHYKNRGYINTPWGKFETIREAAEHPDSNCAHQTVFKRIKRNELGYYYSVD